MAPWRDDPSRPDQLLAARAGPPSGAAARGDDGTADVAIVGAGFTGLWTAIALTDTDPTLRVAVLEAETVGFGASGRNGGFCEASLTHGLANGIRHFPDELERSSTRASKPQGSSPSPASTASTATSRRPARSRSPTSRTRSTSSGPGSTRPPSTASTSSSWTGMPCGPRSTRRSGTPGCTGRRARRPRGPGQAVPRARTGRARAWCPDARAHAGDRPRATRRRRRVTTADRRGVSADHVVVATSAYSGWLRRLSPMFVPVYDYVLVSEPLTPDQRASIGWERPPGTGRREQPVPLLPADGRRPDPVGRLRRDPPLRQPGRPGARPPAGDVRAARGAVLPGVPAARGPRVPVPLGRRDRHDVSVHGHLRPDDGRPRDLCLGYTGLGVGASRWAAGVVRDLILRPDSDRLRLRFVRRAPFPFPPEPLRSLAVDLVRHELDRADRNEGRRGVLLKTLDALGIGFDS